LSVGVPRNADASSIDLASVYEAESDIRLRSGRSAVTCSESKRDRPSLSMNTMFE
jgi:hypothetical protein